MSKRKYVYRHGKRIEVEELDTGTPTKRLTKAGGGGGKFVPDFAKFPRRWAEALRRSKSAATYQLALAILFEAFKQKKREGEIVLSSAVTGMPRETRRRATGELVKFGLIEVGRDGHSAPRVTKMHHTKT